MKYYNLDFDKLKEIQFESLGPFLLDRIRKEGSIFHFIRSDSTGYTIMASNPKAFEYAAENEFPSVPFKQEKNVKLNEIAIEVLNLSRSLLRTPGDEGILSNNSDLIIDMSLFLKELFVLFGLPVAYWKEFIEVADKEAIAKIRKVISQIILNKNRI
ncbi:MAG: hypothetical protein ACXACU_11215 [Candidatus Hodarchaeales archaeon]|jgi:hypothetical protein